MPRRSFSTLTFSLFLLTTIPLSAADIVYVHETRGNGGVDTGATPNAGEGLLSWEDDQWRALLEGAGHTIIDHGAYSDLELDESGLETLNSADIVIFSRDTNSGSYNDPLEHEIWTQEVTAPMIIMTPYVLRNNRWDMADGDAILEHDKVNTIGSLEPLDPDHPIFAGALTDGLADVWDEEILGDADSIDFLNLYDEDGMLGYGTVLAIEEEFGIPWIVYWEAESEFYENSINGWTAGGPRLYYSIGSDDDPLTWGEKNTTEAGDRILLNAINWLAGTGMAGDFNGNDTLDVEDINLLTQETASMNGNPSFDLNGDNQVDSGDVSFWIKDLRNSWIGDANVDGEFNSGDFVQVFQAGKFEVDADATWSDGDWTGDGRFNSSDFVAAFQDGGFEQGPRPAVRTVPEPSSGLLSATVGIAIFIYRRRSNA